MNPAIDCIEDTLRFLLDEAKQAKDAAVANRGCPGEAFEVGRSEALAEILHTWANQLQTFGLDAQLNGIWEDLSAFLASRGFRPRRLRSTSHCSEPPRHDGFLIES